MMLKLIAGLLNSAPSAPKLYRIVRYGNGYEPQMSYSAGMIEGLFWYPLNGDGHWLEPDAFTQGHITMHISMPKTIAQRAIRRAQGVNHKLSVVG